MPASPPDLEQATTRLICAILGSSPIAGTLGMWTRAESALRTAAAQTDYGRAVTKLAEKLEVDGRYLATDQDIIAARAVIEPNFEEWSREVRATYVLLVAVARLAWKAKQAKKSTTDPANGGYPQEPGF